MNEETITLRETWNDGTVNGTFTLPVSAICGLQFQHQMSASPDGGRHYVYLAGIAGHSNIYVNDEDYKLALNAFLKHHAAL